MHAHTPRRMPSSNEPIPQTGSNTKPEGAKHWYDFLREPTELIGWIAIALGAIGAISQFDKVRTTANVSSFSPVYLVLVCVVEALFAVQGAWKKSVTMFATRIGTLTYFMYLTVMYFKHAPSNPDASPPIVPSAAPVGAGTGRSHANDRFPDVGGGNAIP